MRVAAPADGRSASGRQSVRAQHTTHTQKKCPALATAAMIRPKGVFISREGVVHSTGTERFAGAKRPSAVKECSKDDEPRQVRAAVAAAARASRSS